MRAIIVWGCLLAVLIEPCMSDMYMHFPPGSNNRLNGNQDNVRNANRLFDSQVGRHYIAHGLWRDQRADNYNMPISVLYCVIIFQVCCTGSQQTNIQVLYNMFCFELCLLCFCLIIRALMLIAISFYFRITAKLDTMSETNWMTTLETIFKSSDSYQR